MEVSGIEEGDLGSHSTRKGSATNCASGSTSCPSQASICLRAGWSMPGVQGTYIQYEGAGDQYVGPMWNGSFHHLPQDYILPAGTVLVAWQHWVSPTSYKGNPIPPLRSIKPKQDLVGRSAQKRYSDLKYVMQKLEDKVNALLEEEGEEEDLGRNVLSGGISMEKASEMFPYIASAVEISKLKLI